MTTSSKIRIVGVIPARWGSTRFPGKSLAPIAGKPLIQRVVEQVRKAARLDEVLVATDDDRIRRAVESLGARAVMTRSDHASGSDRIAEAVKNVQADVVVNIQGDEPLIDPGLIDELGQAMASDAAWDMATAAAPLNDPRDLANPSVVKVVFNRQGQALYFSRSVIPYIRDADPEAGEEPLHWRHIGIYAYRRAFLERFVAAPPCLLEKAEKLEQLRALDLGGRMKVVKAASCGLGVDTPEDVKRVEEAIKKAG